MWGSRVWNFSEASTMVREVEVEVGGGNMLLVLEMSGGDFV